MSPNEILSKIIKEKFIQVKEKVDFLSIRLIISSTKFLIMPFKKLGKQGNPFEIDDDINFKFYAKILIIFKGDTRIITKYFLW